MTEIWHNPRCSKSRQTLTLLQGRGLDVRVRKYLENPPDDAELRRALHVLGCSAIEIMRPQEAPFSALGLSKTDPDAALIAAMQAHPILIERPIVFHGTRAAIGRPPEAVLEIL